MSNRAQITHQAARDGVPAPTVERDYVLAHIIAGARLEQYRYRWTNELEVHVAGEVPHFASVERAVSRRLRHIDLI